MTWEDKEMIAGCIEKMRQAGCGGCERRDACAQLFPEALAFMFGPRRTTERPRAPSRNPIFSFLSELAKTAEARAQDRKPAPRPNPFRAQVERRLESLLATGEIGIDRVARELGHSRQTLYRRLKAEGVTYEQLLDGLRRRLALRFMREQGLSVKEAAYRLGFSDPAAFSRAFKRWTGTSPGEMRGRR
ncbi:MAG TPA: AraC family transcriptional regulator [Allosphingosinicella sp.]|nr:AraC family transcriptional regulator [Allosphingosinicella sp.]